MANNIPKKKIGKYKINISMQNSWVSKLNLLNKANKEENKINAIIFSNRDDFSQKLIVTDANVKHHISINKNHKWSIEYTIPLNEHLSGNTIQINMYQNR